MNNFPIHGPLDGQMGGGQAVGGQMEQIANMVPMVIETGARGERAFDIFSMLLKERIVYLGTPINDQISNLIVAQLRIAAGEPLWIKQREIRNQGHAIECRINAENPAKGFMPSPGRLAAFVPPGGPGVRVDSHCYSGYSIPPNYDSMIAKLLVHRPTRDEAIRCMIRALDEFVVEGPYTTISFLREVLSHADFLAGLHDTNFVERIFGSPS